MEISEWLLFVVVASVAIMSPGPAVLVAMRNSLNGGARRVMVSSLGNIVGLVCVAGLATLGLGAVLHTAEWLFSLIKVLGAAYLVYLGIRQCRAETPLLSAASVTAQRGWSRWRTFLEGYLVAISNPKAILFFSALFPQFIVPESALVPQFALLIATFMMMSFMTLVGYGLLARRLVSQLRSPRWTRYIQRLMGSLFIGLGISLFRARLPA
ncbi:LysE family translocator [Halomonas elongata]|uniref:LysE family translocator n=1 Tax=Halomonas elongata (strain ATCC 33173 / DSM 2581 / NBRC 15536 / NCIMB 2198 / 1H9) TaxID=768066 RepID=E1V5P7_HALED|nr:LysE family translocator [Halomonas elongata]WBF18396.1 LysE family translocator [Halomonas elongata]WPU47248.1 LysE family translocator [Halomonas elongata DSM 2581]CBV41159.1 LysE family transport protein [Halomonas elongata DSM 2581]